MAFSGAWGQETVEFRSFSVPKNYEKVYEGEFSDHIAYPVGGLGSGMFCIEGNGAMSNLSLYHYPELFNEPVAFAALHIKGVKNGTKVIEGKVQDYKVFGRWDGGMGVGYKTWGFPRFEKSSFRSFFPFADVRLEDRDIPLEVSLTAYNPFIPNNEDDSGLPAGILEYHFKNNSDSTVEAIFSYNATNFIKRDERIPSYFEKMDKGFVLRQESNEQRPDIEGSVAIFAPYEDTRVNYSWFRGNWFDPMTVLWDNLTKGIIEYNEPQDGSKGASLYVPFSLKAGESKTVKLLICWYMPKSVHRMGGDARNEEERGDYFNAADYENYPERYEPWYSRRFSSVSEVADYLTKNEERLRKETELFTKTFYNSSLAPEVMDAVTAALTILKSTTVLRQHDGRLWAWEGSGDSWGSGHGTCTHVWNYAQAIPHLFPRMERSLRETEFFVSQSSSGHQTFRTNIPIRPVIHDFHAAADGQLGGIVKVYRDWRISGDTNWLESIYPAVKKSMEYCIRTWDPDEQGALTEPHHNTYDIEFWGADAMCTGFYLSALKAMSEMGKALGEDVGRYSGLRQKAQRYMEGPLWNGEYFIQKIQWKGLKGADPTTAQSMHSTYSPEAKALLEKEGPKYQYGNACIADALTGVWLGETAGLNGLIDREKAKSSLNALWKYNLKKDLFDHSNPQRPGYALNHDGGLLMGTWPRGDKLSLPFVYSDEVWTGVEYAAAASLIFEGEVERGLDIVRTARKRYDGRVRNPYNEYEFGSWYARSMSSYSLLQALTGVRYDKVSKTLHIDSKVGDNFKTFLSFDGGYGTVSLQNGKPYIKMAKGKIDIDNCLVSGKKKKLRYED